MDIAPLTRAGWRGPDACWDALVQAAPLRRSIHRVARRRATPPADLEHDAFLLLFERAARRGGLADPPAGTPAPAWLARVGRNAAIDCVRRARTPGVVPLDEPIAVIGDPELACDLARVVRRAATVDLPGPWALVWTALEAPEDLTEALVTAAIGALARDAAATWRLLEAFRATRPEDPRLALAWILRSADRRDAEAWAKARPRVAARARDLVRTWYRRAVERRAG